MRCFRRRRHALAPVLVIAVGEAADAAAGGGMGFWSAADAVQDYSSVAVH